MNNLSEREILFNIQVLTTGIEYENKMLKEFFDYWSEPNKKGKMKWELEKTWDIKRRLKRWFDNQNKWNVNSKNNAGGVKLGTSAARTEALKNWPDRG